jgi:hypothetical protein
MVMRPKAEALGYLTCSGAKEGGDGGVERGEGGGFGEFDGGDEDGVEAECAEGFGEGRGLVSGARDEDSFGHMGIRADGQCGRRGSEGERGWVQLRAVSLPAAS